MYCLWKLLPDETCRASETSFTNSRPFPLLKVITRKMAICNPKPIAVRPGCMIVALNVENTPARMPGPSVFRWDFQDVCSPKERAETGRPVLPGLRWCLLLADPVCSSSLVVSISSDNLRQEHPLTFSLLTPVTFSATCHFLLILLVY